MIQIGNSMKKQLRKKKSAPTKQSTLDANRAIDLVVALMKIPGPSCHEEKMVEQVRSI